MAVDYTTITNNGLISSISDSAGIPHGLNATKLQGKTLADFMQFINNANETFVVDPTVDTVFKSTASTITLTTGFTDVSGTGKVNDDGTYTGAIGLSDLKIGDIVHVKGSAYPERIVETITKNTSGVISSVTLAEYFKTQQVTLDHVHDFGPLSHTVTYTKQAVATNTTTAQKVKTLNKGKYTASFKGVAVDKNVSISGTAHKHVLTDNGHTHEFVVPALTVTGTVNAGTVNESSHSHTVDYGATKSTKIVSVTGASLSGGSVASGKAAITATASGTTESASSGISAALASGTVTLKRTTNGAVTGGTTAFVTGITAGTPTTAKADATAVTGNTSITTVVSDLVYNGTDESLTFSFVNLGRTAASHSHSFTNPVYTATVGTAVTITDPGHTHGVSNGAEGKLVLTVSDGGHTHAFTRPTLSAGSITLPALTCTSTKTGITVGAGSFSGQTTATPESGITGVLSTESATTEITMANSTNTITGKFSYTPTGTVTLTTATGTDFVKGDLEFEAASNTITLTNGGVTVANHALASTGNPHT